MAADHDIRHAQRNHGIFDGRGNAARLRPKDGTIFPALRMTKSCPGSCWVTSSGTRRLSEQEMKSALGFWLEAEAAEEFFTLGKISSGS